MARARRANPGQPGQNRTVNSAFPIASRKESGYRKDRVDAFLERARLSYENTQSVGSPLGDTGSGVRANGAEANVTETADTGAANTAAEVLTSSDIRSVAFPLKRKGYSARHVDAAMDRLEEVFFDRERRTRMAEIGEEAWWAETRQLLSEVRGRLDRTAGKRFRRRGWFASGYRRSEVDAFLDTVTEMLHGRETLTTAEVRGVVFHSQWRGYHEDQVDALLDAVIVLMLAIR